MMARGFKTGGRQKGTPNAKTSELRNILKEIFARQSARIEELLEQLEPKDQLTFILKMGSMITPAPAPISEGADKAQENPDPFFDMAEKAVRERFTEFNP